jgi:glycosyltransferase involved in cell wall biosynthesis
MRIALLSTCAASVPPEAYGGTELVIWELSKTLSRFGHEVTVFATGDSRPAGRLRWHFPRPVWPPNEMADLRHSAHAWREICSEDPPFDVVHVHQAPAVSFSTISPVPTVSTLHHDRNQKLVDYYNGFRDVTYVAISRRQAELLPEIDVRHVVYHGLDGDECPAGDGRGGWLAFVGRLAAEKGPDIAIDAARAAGLPLHVGGKPHWVNEPFFESEMILGINVNAPAGRLTVKNPALPRSVCRLELDGMRIGSSLVSLRFRRIGSRCHVDKLEVAGGSLKTEIEID